VLLGCAVASLDSVQHHGGVFDRGVALISIIDSSCPIIAHSLLLQGGRYFGGVGVEGAG